MTPPLFVTPSKVPAIGIISTTPSCSYWSHWINKGKPRRGKRHGDREDTKPDILRQTEGFCLDVKFTVNLLCNVKLISSSYSRHLLL